jgi:GNAT superfamily N-acetyltransferase
MSAPRPAVLSDVPELLRLIVELAVYEKEPDAVRTTEADLERALFGDAPAVFAFVVDGDEPGELAGLAIWFLTFSTWEGVHGIHLEDLYVAPQHRGAGHGRALLARLAQEAVTRGLARVEWAVLDWNEPSIGFYRSLGAASMDDWTTFRLDGDALASLGGPAAS